MNVLITGSQGQLGCELTKIIKSGKSEIGSNSKISDNFNIFKTDKKKLNICDLDNVRLFCKENKIDLIINCAAYVNVDKCETDQDTAFMINALGPRNLAIVANEIEAKLVHISTDYVFSGNRKVPYQECSICDPKNIYGMTKYLGEQYARDFCNKYFIIRSAWLYGYTGNNFVKTILKLSKEKDFIPVVNDQVGNPTSANDLAYHILKISNTNEYGIYHCTGEGECSWYDFACKIIEYANLNCQIQPCSTQEFPRPAKRPTYSSLDNMMLRCTAQNEMRNWQDALREYINNIS